MKTYHFNKLSLIVLSLVGILMMSACACSHSNKAEERKSDSLGATRYKPAEIDTVIKITEKSYLDNLHDPHAFDSITVYAKPDTNATVIAIIPPLTRLNVISGNEYSTNDTIRNAEGQPEPINGSIIFYQIKLSSGKTGYLRPGHMAEYVYTDNINKLRYFMGQVFNKKRDWIFRVAKYDLQSNRLIDNYEHFGFSEAVLEIFVIKSSPLKNVDRIIKVVAHADFCGGSETGVLIADANNHLTALPENFDSFDDGGGIENTMVYLPHVNHIGKVFLGVDTTGQSYEKKNIAYPKELNIPLDELLVETTEAGQYFMDKDNTQVKLKNGKYKMETPLTLTTQYYRWDGKSFSKLPRKTVTKL